MKRLYLLAALWLLAAAFPAVASDHPETKQVNFYLFSQQRKSESAEMAQHSTADSRNHPDYGVLPFTAPCKDCYEDLSQRKADYRYFIVDGSNGAHFFKQQSLGAINYRDAAGYWREINPFLEPSGSGVYKAMHQPYPVTVDLARKSTTIVRDGYAFEFNKSLELYHLAADGKMTSLGTPDWSNYTAGDEGVRIISVYPGIDLEIIAGQGSVKANFILNTNPGFHDGWIVMKQGFAIPEGLHAMLPVAKDKDGHFLGSFQVMNEQSEEIFGVASSFVYDNNQDNEQRMVIGSQLNDQTLLSYVPVSWLNQSSLVYPVTLDPLVTASQTLAQPAISGSGYNATCFLTGCSYALPAITVPAACTVTDIKSTFSYTASNLCMMKDGGFRISYNGCSAPSASLAFTNPANITGTASFNSSLLSYLASCVPAPSCATYNMNFTMDFFRCNQDPNGGCASTCISAGSAWTVTIEGHTVELPTISPAHIMCTGSSTNLSATAAYGVMPYSYVWNPGALAGSSVTVSPAANQTYTCTVTDACNNTATNSCSVTVTAGAPASVTISPSAPLCSGNPITFTATGNNGGPAPTFAFYVNGIPVQNSPSNTYTYTPALSGDSISVEMTSNSPCSTSPGAVSAWVVTTATSNASVSLVPSPNPPYCVGQTITLTATPTQGGPALSYGWTINGVFVAWTTGANNTYTYTIPSGVAKTFKVWMVSSLPCVNNDTVASLGRAIVGLPISTPTVSITPDPVDECENVPLLLTANASQAGAPPNYQWQLNGIDQIGETNSTYSIPGGLLAGNYTISVVVTSTAQCNTIGGDSDTVSVNIHAISPATVAISQNPLSPCGGTPITFTATPNNGGLAPTYQWQINGVNVPGETASTFTTSAITQPGTMVNVVLTSSSACAVPPTDSASLAVAFTPADTPQVSVFTATGFPICPNTSVTFNTTASGGGANPSFQWFVNGNPVGTNSGTYTQTFSAASTVAVVFTGSSTCLFQPSDTDTIQVTISAPVTPAVSIIANPAGTICQGTSVTFTADTTNGNGGSAPTFQWTVNGIPVGSGITYTTNTLANGDNVGVTMTASGCVSPTTATAQVIMTVNPSTPPAVNLTQSPASPCPGSAITFSAHTTNGGTAPTFQWWVNGNPVVPPPADSVFSSSALVSGDLIKVTLHSNVACPGASDSASTTLNATFAPAVTPVVTSITQAPPGPNCLGTALTFTANITGGGSAPTFQWQVNGVNVPGATSSTYTTSTLAIGDNVSVIMTSNAPCASPLTANNSINPTITPNDIPVVTMTPPAGDSTCQSAQATFTAAATAFGGSNPTYQWFVNGVAAGTGTPFNISTLANGDVVKVVMTSNDPCAAPVTDTDQVTMIVIPNVVPSVTLTVAPNDSICGGDNAIFTTVIANGGSNPQYQWYNNGVAIGGATADNYSSTTLTNGNVISVVLTSDARCAVPPTDTDRVTMTVTTNVPSVTIAAVPTGAVCENANVTFTATPVHPGTAPVYQWSQGGNPVGTNSATYATTTLVNGQQVTVTMTSNDYCAQPPQVVSNAITANVVLYQTPAVSINANPSGTICVGNPVTFTAVPVYGGTTPAYQWHVNGINVGTNSSTFVSSTLQDGDVVDVTLTSNYQCVTANTAASNQIVIDAAQPLQVSISGFTGTVCPGVPVTLTASAVGGLQPYHYTWTQNAGTDSVVVVAPHVTTSYAVAVSDVCGSTIARDTVVVDVYPSPAANFSYSPQNPSTLAPEVQFTDLSNAATTWAWDFGDSATDNSQNPKHTYDAFGYFAVKLLVQNAFGCLDSVQYTIFVKDEVAMYIPNSFTPDGDGNNDLFGPIGYNLGTYNMKIYDRWGELVFQGNEYTPWDGRRKDNGKVAQMGVYIYRIYFDDPKYTEPVVVGRVTIAK